VDWPSVDELVPDEPGAEEARRGFAFQDHVAAGFYLDMAAGDELTTVWCESDDDVTLVWCRQASLSIPLRADHQEEASAEPEKPVEQRRSLTEASVEVEFVQVKGNEHDQLWSVSLLCEPKKGRNGRALAASSILEKSLLRDRYREASRFRIVTIRPVKNELELLELPFDHAMRQPASAGYQVLAEKLPARVKETLSRKGNSWTYWVARVRWDVRHSDQAVQDRNLHLLEQVLRRLQGYLAPDQRELIYWRLVRRAFDAALARRLTEPHLKRLRRDELIALLRAVVADAQRAGEDDNGLESALRSAGLSVETIRHARESRLRYLEARRSTAYYPLGDRETEDRLEAEVAARLHLLLARLESGEIDESPSAFYARCLAELDAIRQASGPAAPPLALLQGMLYDRVHRRMHRFDRAAS
jgi:hypothetical protein